MTVILLTEDWSSISCKKVMMYLRRGRLLSGKCTSSRWMDSTRSSIESSLCSVEVGSRNMLISRSYGWGGEEIDESLYTLDRDKRLVK